MNKHKPVLLQETIKWLNPKNGAKIIDATFGFGGHSKEILKKIGKKGNLLAIDQDRESFNVCQNYAKHENQILCCYGNFRDLDSLARSKGFDEVGGLLLDLGFSSAQVDLPERGFSFQKNGPLDMRMDQGQELTAKEIVSNWEKQELVRIFSEYGEERYASSIANQIILARSKKEIETTLELVEVIKKGVPGAYTRQKLHFATRTFQALRIAVNDELNSLREALVKSLDLLSEGARLAVISFHSLEDRIVKEFFTRNEKRCTCPPKFPKCICGTKARLKILTKKPICASEVEVRANPRARSAKLRVAEKI